MFRCSRLILLFGLLLPPALAHALPRENDPGVRLFLDNRIAESLPLLEQGAREAPRDADALAWLADCLRRLGRLDSADSTARGALALAPCHAFAHLVLANAYNPLYSGWERADADSAWRHVQLATTCDPGLGEAWSYAWVQALAHGDRVLEKQALRSMVSTGFLTPGLLAYARWALKSLPENAVYVCNGDMDTYPAVALQATEGLRPDVVVLNVGLLNTPWYRRIVRDRYALPLAADDGVLDSMQVMRLQDGSIRVVHQQILGAWLDSLAMGRFGRPLTAAITLTDEAFASEKENRAVLAGPFRELQPAPVLAEVDSARVRHCFAFLDRAAARGPYVSTADHSPVRRAYTERLHDNIGELAVKYATEVAKGGDRARLRAAVDWARRLVRETGGSGDLVRELASLRAGAGGRSPR
jgi:hypothetical protein